MEGITLQLRLDGESAELFTNQLLAFAEKQVKEQLENDRMPIQASEIRIETGLSKRKLEEVIESLRVNFGHPIVAKKMKPNGYYLPRSEEERQAGLAPYRRQILTEQKNLAAVMNIDLREYWGMVYDFKK